MVSRTAAVAVLFVALVALVYCETDPETPEVADRVRRGVKTRCTPGTTFMVECNTCFCNNDGTTGACTARGCLKRSARAASCTPGTTYMDRCNVCRCGSRGTPDYCTRAACLP